MPEKNWKEIYFKTILRNYWMMIDQNQLAVEIHSLGDLEMEINSENITKVEVNFNEFQEVEKMTVILTKDSYLKTFKEHFDDVKINHNIENIVSYKKILSNQKLLLFVSSGRVYTIDPNSLPTGKSNPKSFIFFVESSSNEKLIGILPYVDDLKCIVASKFGKGFIADLSEIQTSQKKVKKLLPKIILIQ